MFRSWVGNDYPLQKPSLALLSGLLAGLRRWEVVAKGGRKKKVNQIISILVAVIVIVVLIYLLMTLL